MEFAIFSIVVAGSVIYAANLQDIRTTKASRFSVVNLLLLLLAILGILLGVYVMLQAVASPVSPDEVTSEIATVGELTEIGLMPALGFLTLSVILGSISIVLVFSENFRQWIAINVIRSDDIERRYNPQSVVHTTAIILAFLEILNVVGGFILAGGIEGLADELAASGMSIDLLVAGLLTNVLIALLGVGLFLRRDGLGTLHRLALNSVTLRQVIIGASIGFFGFWMVTGVSYVWSMLLSPEELAAQSAASEQLFLAFSGSLFAGFMLAATAAIGEEILFRGALQPIFGIFWTSIFFMLLHTQYTLTPAALMIFGISIAFGWLRRRYNTTTAIIAHFVYNFVPFLLFWLVAQIPTESLIP